ncbi:hypothetical protein TNCV_889671 [Trichonephila clavipes]|nr:hypothetical protein TNCV_889671 [Trichonephila clavipes]
MLINIRASDNGQGFPSRNGGEIVVNVVESGGVKSQDLGGQFTGPKREIRRSPNVFQYIDCGTSCVTCCAVLLEPQLLDIMIVQFRNEKVSNHGSTPITIDCNVVAFIVFEEGFHQPIKRTKQSVFLDVTVFRHTLVD